MTHAPSQSPGITRIAPNCWEATVIINGREKVLGPYPHQADAIRARQATLARIDSVNAQNEAKRIKLPPCPFDLPSPRPEPTRAARGRITAYEPMPRGVALHQTLKTIIAELRSLEALSGPDPVRATRAEHEGARHEGARA